jgi:hypothetical protein
MKHARSASYLRGKSIVWWVTLFLAILTGAVLYRWVVSILYQVEALFWVDIAVYAIVWVVLQIISLVIVKRLFGDGVAYALAKALVIATNPVTITGVYALTLLFQFDSPLAILYTFTQPGQIGLITLDWLGFMRIILAISIVFLAICTLRVLYIKRRGLFSRHLAILAAIACVGAILLFTHQFVPTRADRALRLYLGHISYHVIEKHPMWACCMIRRFSSDIAATDIYYKISTNGGIRYIEVIDESSNSEFEIGTQKWKASSIDKTTYEIFSKPW